MKTRLLLFRSIFSLLPMLLWAGVSDAVGASSKSVNIEYFRISDERDPNSLLWCDIAMAMNNVDTLFMDYDGNVDYRYNSTYCRLRNALKGGGETHCFLFDE